MATWNEQYYKGEDVYSDGRIEDYIYDCVKKENITDKVDEIIGDNYTLAYHLSPIRENILNWYPFQKAQSAIEIGAGCGAITGLLCKKLAEVVSVDLSKKRSLINYERHKDCPNLQIIVGNFNDIELEHKYDYVILNGVLEYALSFTNTKHPYEDFLRNISRFLTPEGKLLIAIENKLGLKYFNGAKEDHTGNYFLGLNGYEGNETVRTFTKQELSDILKKIGFPHIHFYYPYPDYKFPNEIFTDETLETNQYGRPVTNIEEDRYTLFNENTVNEFLIKEHIRDIFANSFLVEASRNSFVSTVSYAKLNMERNKQFRIGTVIKTIRESKEVVKFPLNDIAKSHISNIYDTAIHENKGRVSYLSAKKSGEEITFSYLPQQNLDSILNSYIEEENQDEIIGLLERFYKSYLQEFSDTRRTSEYLAECFQTFFGSKKNQKPYLCVKNANIDVILDNIYEKNGNYILIDGEWIYPEWIPYMFLVWRSVNELYVKHASLERLISRKSLMEKFSIVEDDEILFRSWAEHFAEVYVGSSQRINWAKKMQPISLDDIHQRAKRKECCTMSMYVDYGEGFSEEEKKFQDIKLNEEEFEVTFSFDDVQRIKRLRFDPVEGIICQCIIHEISAGFYEEGNNADSSQNGKDLFLHTDPQYDIRLDGTSNRVMLRGCLHFLSEEEIKTLLINMRMKSAELVNEMQRKEIYIDNLKANFSQRLELIEQNYSEEREKRNLEYYQMMEERKQLVNEKEQLISFQEQLVSERDYYKCENEKNAYLANNTKAFLKRKFKQKFGRVKQ